MAGPNTVRIDLRAALPIVVLGIVVLVIIFVQLCGREKVAPLGDITPQARATRAPTFTPGPSVTAAPAQETEARATAAGGAERDRTRAGDLLTISQVLAQYFQEHNSYPDTKGSIQTLCVFKEFDKGCDLEDVAAIPSDPLGNPAENGYWYRSDGQTYTVFAQREASEVPECAEHPEHLKAFKSVMCVQS